MLFDIVALSIMVCFSVYMLVGASLGMIYLEHFYGKCRQLPEESHFPCMIRSIMAWPAKFPFGVRK